ncbi:hypothetical protein BCS37_03020 [Selenomonas sp. oral taxon 920]|uniref:hypothetical protein n=1 Tax=Selenomonas sp. oral taxon 920 TaxID=1884263 RepID=UPI000840F8B3|nr:hypothetical protein [Selenomonas sp. oral taxon 920]AOH47477.1 hypothetical protein BCS37_03020 [Selenomonas sp. oral taxon 920]
MEPIVSPWIFYWVDVVSGLRWVLLGTMTAFICFCIIVAVHVLVEFDDGYEAFVGKYYKKIKTFVVLIMVNILLLIAIPGKDTMITMIVAQYTTENNLNYILDVSKQIIEATKKDK